MTEKEKTLLAGCLRREKAAWDAFVLQYSSLVYHTIKKTFAFYHTDPRTDIAEDLFQEVFLSLVQNDFKKLRQFRGDRGCSLASWLRVVAARLTIDFLRKQKVSTVEVPNEFPSSDPELSLALIDHEREKSLLEALENLPARDRLFVRLYYHKGLPLEEIAAILKVSVNAVYTLKSRALDKLRETVGKVYPV